MQSFQPYIPDMKNAANREALGYGQDDSNVRQNLADADCPEEAVACFMALRSGGNIPEQLTFLAMHRKTLLGRMRQAQHALDCLDFLVVTIKKQSRKSET